jgi:cation diffusion facilitator CzcD-associated flavoprotein CzcO
LMLDWIIIGGGPHGVHAAARLIGEAGVPREAVAILDDEETLLARWRRCTRNTGMRYLRSPVVHHVDLSSASLRRFASRGRGRRIKQPFTRPYSRPSLELFDLHCNEVIDKFGLTDLHVRGRANALEISDQSVRVGFEGASSGDACPGLEAKRVVLALGAPRDPVWPDWARRAESLASEAGRPSAIAHVFDPGFELADDADDEVVVVVGAGLSGAQVAIRLAREGRRLVLISREPVRVHQFDSDPGWQGPKYMAGYSRLSDPRERRERIRDARHRGSMPADVHAALRRGFATGAIEHLEGVEVGSAGFDGGRLWLDLGHRRLEADRVLLATGFSMRRPGAGWLDEAIAAHDLPCAECGYPLVDRGLRWHPRVLVTGALAELEVGPVARNLSGAQRAGERIAAVAQKEWN